MAVSLTPVSENNANSGIYILMSFYWLYHVPVDEWPCVLEGGGEGEGGGRGGGVKTMQFCSRVGTYW